MNPHRTPAPSVRPLPLGVLAALALAPACHESSGGSGGNNGGGGTNNPLVVDFALRTDLHLGSAFLGDMLHEDVNQDGVEDLVEANFGTKFLTIAIGHLNGSFTVIHELPTTGHAFRLASGDLDGNGLRDIAVACGDWVDGADQAVQVFLQGPAAGEFGPSAVYDLDTDPKDLCSMPLSGIAGDPGPDELFVALRDANQVLRLALAGGVLVSGGTLDSANLGPGVAPGGPFSVAALDVGGDGLLDLVVGEENPGVDRVIEFPRTAAGFQPAELLLEPLARPVVDRTGDMDGNGFEDLAIAQLGADEVFLLAGDAAGLSGAAALDFGGETTSLLFEDLDGDGLAEAVATLFRQESIQVRRALAPFVWDEAVHYNVGIGPRAIGVIELPGDTNKDLLCANAQDLSLLLGNGLGAFRCATGASTGSQRPILVDTADLDADGDQDAVAITRFQETLVFLENQGGELAGVKVLDLQPTQEDDSGFLALADLDLDGDVDVIVTVFESDELRVYRNQGGPASFTDPAPGDVIAVGDGPLGIDLGDLDDDGLIDVVVGNVEGQAVQVLRGLGGGALELRPPLALPFSPLTLLCADFDNDGLIDVAATARTGGVESVALLAGDGTGGLALASTFDLPAITGGLSMGDIDEDGTLDLAVGQFDVLGDELVVLRNLGGFAFLAQALSIAPGPGTPLVADADEDGNMDILVLTTDGELAVVRGDGTGGFVDEPRTRGELPCPDGTVSGTLADLDGDSLPELLMVSPESPFVWVARNVSQEQVSD